MTSKFTGSCLCDEVSYKATSAPQMGAHCHVTALDTFFCLGHSQNSFATWPHIATWQASINLIRDLHITSHFANHTPIVTLINKVTKLSV